MREETKYSQAIGIDFGGTSVKCGVAKGREIKGEIERIPTKSFTHAEALLDAIAEKIKDLHERYPKAECVGVGVPGAVDFERGITYNLTNVPGWDRVPLKDILFDKTGLPVVVDNDANCVAYAEWRFGSARIYKNVVAVTLGTGVGGGLILNGELFRGSRSAAGEIGQISVDYQGREGPYGNFGCLERYIGHEHISRHAMDLYMLAGKTEEVAAERANLEVLSKSARDGDPVARQAWGDVATWLAHALANIVWVLNPDAILVGGGVAAAGDVLFDPLRKCLQSLLSEEFWEMLHVIPAEFGNTAGVLGAAALANEYIGKP